MKPQQDPLLKNKNALFGDTYNEANIGAVISAFAYRKNRLSFSFEFTLFFRHSNLAVGK